jgi:hypothetical protein
VFVQDVIAAITISPFFISEEFCGSFFTQNSLNEDETSSSKILS